MATSSVPATKAALLALIQGRVALASLHAADAITWGHPHKQLKHESVWLGDADFEREEVAALRTAPHPKTEIYALPVLVFMLNEGEQTPSAVQQALEERWWVVVGEIEEAVRAAPTLGVAGVLSAVVVSKTPHSAISSGVPGWVHEGEVVIAVQARI